MVLDAGLLVNDVDSGGNLTGATVKVSTGFLAGDALNFTNANGITGSYNAATGVLTLSGTATLAQYQAALQSITYSFTPANGDPTAAGTDTTRTISWVVNDGSAVNGSSAPATSTLTDVHVAPTVTAGGTAILTGGGPAVVLDAGLLVNDVDSGGNLTGATVKVSTGFLAGDALNFTNANGITGSYNAATGVLTLSGTATLAQYQAALQSITYSFTPANGDPTAAGTDTTRTISWVVNDGSAVNGSSAPATSTLTDVHVAPTVTAGGTATFTGGGPAVVLDAGLLVNDVDSGGNLTGATVKVSTGFLAGDALNFTNANGITGSYNAATGVLTLSGTATLAQYQAALQSITYSFTPANGDPTAAGTDTTRTISWVVNDGSAVNGVTPSAPVTSTLTDVHVAPTVTTAGGTATFTGGGGPAVVLDAGLLHVNDVDSGGNLTGATVKVSTGFLAGDTLNFIQRERHYRDQLQCSHRDVGAEFAERHRDAGAGISGGAAIRSPTASPRPMAIRPPPAPTPPAPSAGWSGTTASSAVNGFENAAGDQHA